MEKQVPVIFYHVGNQQYLKTAIRQCRKYNEEVILLGDETNQKMAAETGCTWFLAKDYDEKEQWKHFEEKYVGMSTNDYLFELNCFRRFFVIHELIKARNIDRFVYLDSDILSYVNFSSLDALWLADSGMSVPKEQSRYGWVANCGISFWNRKSLTSFLDYCIDVYENNIEILEEKWNYHRNQRVNGGICDMTLQFLWYKNNESCRKINLVDRDNDLPGVMDFNINLSMNCYEDEYVMNDLIGIKKISFDNNQPYLCSKDGKLVPVLAIHFLGPAKQYMKSYSENNSLRAKDYFIYYLKKLKASLVRWRK